MRHHVPIDLLRVEPRLWGDLGLAQAVSLGAAGILGLLALTGRMGVPEASLLAAGLAGYALLEVEGQPLRRLAPRILRHGIRGGTTQHEADALLWTAGDGPEKPQGGRAVHRVRRWLESLLWRS